MRRLDQDVVAGGVAEAVVDRLEVVQVDEEDRQIADLAPVEGVLDALPEEAPVGQPGQRVVERLEGELLFERLAFLQVAGVQDDAGRVAVEGAARGDSLDRQPVPSPWRSRHSPLIRWPGTRGPWRGEPSRPLRRLPGWASSVSGDAE